MILTTLPDLPPRPQTAANAAFRQQFHARSGHENAIVSGRSTHAEYAAIPQTLSIKMTVGSRERYFLPRREVVVDDDNLLVLNEGSCYGSLLQATRAAWTFAIFFRPGMQEELAAQPPRTLQATPPAARPALRAEWRCVGTDRHRVGSTRASRPPGAGIPTAGLLARAPAMGRVRCRGRGRRPNRVSGLSGLGGRQLAIQPEPAAGQRAAAGQYVPASGVIAACVERPTRWRTADDGSRA